MAIKLKREQLERIVLEELTRYLSEQLNEAGPSRGTVLDDEPEEEGPPEDEIPNPGEAPEEQLPDDSPAPEVGDMGDGPPPELAGDEEPMDQDLDAIEAGEEPPSEEEAGTVAGELSGKTIENISVDEDSKIMPGATELIITFRENPDAFRVLTTKTGKVKYFYRGLHNTLDSAISPVPEDDAPEEELPGEEDMGDMPPEGEEDLEDMPPLGDDDMPPPDEEEVPPEELP